jgi:hypothetical protein
MQVPSSVITRHVSAHPTASDQRYSQKTHRGAKFRQARIVMATVGRMSTQPWEKSKKSHFPPEEISHVPYLLFGEENGIKI